MSTGNTLMPPITRDEWKELLKDAIREINEEKKVNDYKEKLLDKELLTTKECMSLLGVGRTALFNKVANQKVIKVIKGGKPYYPTIQFK